MTREEAKKLLPIIKAYAEGKTIESRCIKGDTSLWYDDKDPNFDDDFEYRIKPEKVEDIKNIGLCPNDEGTSCSYTEMGVNDTEFKDGDVLFVKCMGGAFIEIFNYSKNNGDLYDHASLDTTTHELDITGEYKIIKENIRKIRLATEEEKQQLFSVLKKEGKSWDSNKKSIVDLKPKVELKPFDRVLVRDCEDQAWKVSLFSYKDSDSYYCCNGCAWNQCIPYIGNESLLGTTKDVEG